MRDGAISIEDEYHALCQYPDGSMLPATDDDLISGLFTGIPTNASPSGSLGSLSVLPAPRHDLPGIFSDRRLCLPNGAQAYLDSRRTPEYAGPECRGPREAALYNVAGQFLMAGFYAHPRPDGSRVGLFKNNIGLDQNGVLCTTVGTHENYQTSLRPNSPALVSFLIPFLVSRQIITGNGWVDEKGRYCYSQRALCMHTDVGNVTTSDRAILSTRDEPHTGILQDKIKRLHLICGDARMSEYQIWLSLGITALVLSMIEDGICFKWEYARSPLSDHKLIAKQMRNVSYDFADRGQTRLITVKGAGRVSAYTLQTWYLEEAEKYLKKTDFASEHSEAGAWEVLHAWSAAMNAIYSNDIPWLGEHFDYMMKWRFMQAYMQEYRIRKNIAPQSAAWLAKQKQLELKYHELAVPGSGKKSVSQILHGRYPAARLFSDEEVLRAQYEPPQTTRARMRGEFVKAMMRAGEKSGPTIDWSNIWYRGDQCAMPDPLESRNFVFDRMMSYLES